MDDPRSNITPGFFPNLPSRYGSSSAANSNIRGDYSGNSGSYNITNSSNTTIVYDNHGGMNTPDKCAEILQCLYTSAYESHRNRIREPVEGTCTWVTEHPKYKDWLGKESSGLLWLSADPGCGKSVIASFLVSHLKWTEAIVCYFFFKDDSEEQRSATFALCAILHQLILQRNFLYIYAEEAFRAKGKRFTEEVDTLWDILVKTVAEGKCGDVVCVVDALDECKEETLAPFIRHMTRHLGSQQASDTSLKFIVTGRPYHKIEKGLDSRTATIRLKGEDEVSAITADVTRVIDEGIKGLESYWGQPGRLGYLRNLLESSADRTFLWVSLVLNILEDSEDGSQEELVNMVSTAPRDLAELYTKILNKSAHPDKARRILNIVVAAARPLTLREMNVAFRVRRERNPTWDLEDPVGCERAVKNYCGLFVRVINSKIYLVHQTAREFLIKGSLPGRGNWQYTLCPKDFNFVMADICITYLSIEEFEDEPLAMDTYRARREAVGNYLQKYAFLDYAARHWADHFRDSQDQQKELIEFTRRICEAGSGRFLAWFGVYWFSARPLDQRPQDWTHLMIASWLGQGKIVERLLEEGGDINARSELYGTALNIAALRKDEDMTRMLLQWNVKAYINGKEYNIFQTKRSELEELLRPSYRPMSMADLSEMSVIEFLIPFCLPNTPDSDTPQLYVPHLYSPRRSAPHRSVRYGPVPREGSPHLDSPRRSAPHRSVRYGPAPREGSPHLDSPRQHTPYENTPNPDTPNPDTQLSQCMAYLS